MRDRAHAIRNLINEHLRPPPRFDRDIDRWAGSSGNFMRRFDGPARKGKLPEMEAMQLLANLLGVPVREVARAAFIDADLDPVMDYDADQTKVADLLAEIPDAQTRQQFVEIFESLVGIARRTRCSDCQRDAGEEEASPPPK